MLRKKWKITKPCRFRPKTSRWWWHSEVPKQCGFSFGSVHRNNTIHQSQCFSRCFSLL